MKPQVFTVHAEDVSVEALIDSLSSSLKDRPTYQPDYIPEAVINRLKENLQYNASPAISHVHVSKEDAKILLELAEGNLQDAQE